MTTQNLTWQHCTNGHQASSAPFRSCDSRCFRRSDLLFRYLTEYPLAISIAFAEFFGWRPSGTMGLGLRPELRSAGASLRVEQPDELLPLRRGGRSPLGCVRATEQTRTSGSLDALDVLVRCPGALALPARAVRALVIRALDLSRRAAALTRSEDEGFSDPVRNWGRCRGCRRSRRSQCCTSKLPRPDAATP